MSRRAKSQGVQRIASLDDLDHIVFTDGVAAVEAPAEMLDLIDFKNDQRMDSPRLATVEQSIREKGYQPLDPIIARIGRRGRWVIVDGGHRLTAARRVSHGFWANLFGPKVRNVYFLLFETPLSRSKLKAKRSKRKVK